MSDYKLLVSIGKKKDPYKVFNFRREPVSENFLINTAYGERAP